MSLESPSRERHLRPVQGKIEYRRRFTEPDSDPFNTVEWGRRDVTVGDFFQPDVEAPITWSDQAVGVVAKLYFATVNGVREDSVRQIIERVVNTIVDEMAMAGYFDTAEARRAFDDELTYALVHQYLTFNTPVWLNLGVPGREPYCSACYLLATEDHMVGEDGITGWWDKEARIFKSGAGSGINLSTLRGSMEPLSTGGTASGPVAYMRPADAGAGTLKSGGAHRRAAKFVRLDDDHPDVLDFITVKAREDLRMRALMEAGFDLDPTTLEGEKLIAECTSAQNANLSVGIHDDFMKQAIEQPDYTGWELRARVTGEVIDTVSAAGMLAMISESAWQCGDPGVQFHDTINRWHTTPSLGEIHTSNPCGETLLNDDSSCNIGSLNVAKYVDDNGCFDVDGFCHHVDVLITAMDATCSFSTLPTEKITKNTRELRQLGMGYANLGAALMIKGLPYDSDEGRDFAASISALMTGRAYRRSSELAEHLGAFTHFDENSDTIMGVLGQHAEAIKPMMVGRLWDRARVEWMMARGGSASVGLRNSQVTLVAPTGTTSFMMGCDTTGIEPGFSLVSHKSLAGGGTMVMVNGMVERALYQLGYDDTVVQRINAEIRDGSGNVADFIRPEHRPVFATAVGSNSIDPMGHVKMVAAVQPFLSQGVSKTVNMPEECTPEDIRDVYVASWRMGLKSISIYRDNSKATQVLSTKPKAQPEVLMTDKVKKMGLDPEKWTLEVLTSQDDQIRDEGLRAIAERYIEAQRTELPTLLAPTPPQRRRMPRQRKAEVVKFEIAGHDGYFTVGMYDDGTPGEIFLNGIGKDGSTLRGFADQWATDFSIALQYGTPLETLIRKHAYVKFPPEGPTGDPDVPIATSIPDYIARKLAAMFLDADTCEELGVMTDEVRNRKAMETMPTATASDIVVERSSVTGMISGMLPFAGDQSPMMAALVSATTGNGHHETSAVGASCDKCGGSMRRTGSCWICETCYASTGCG